MIGFLREKGMKEVIWEWGWNGPRCLAFRPLWIDIIIFSDIVVGMQHAGTIHILCFSVTHFIWHASTNQSCSFKVSLQCPFLAQNRGNCNYAEDISIFFSYGRIYVPIDDARIFLDLLWE